MVSVEDEALTIEGDENSDVRDVVTPVVTVPGEIIVKVSLHEISGERCWHSTVICSVESVANITGLLLEKGQTLIKETCLFIGFMMIILLIEINVLNKTTDIYFFKLLVHFIL